MKAVLSYCIICGILLLIALLLKGAQDTTKGLIIMALVLAANIAMFWRFSRGRWL